MTAGEPPEQGSNAPESKGLPPELLDTVRDVVDAVAASQVEEFTVEREGFLIRIRRSHSGTARAGEPIPAPPEENAHTVRAPLSGIFYRAPSPTADPYVHEGDWVEPDTVIGLVEAMKVFNQVTADAKGRVARILVDSGTLIEAGAGLLELDHGASETGTAIAGSGA